MGLREYGVDEAYIEEILKKEYRPSTPPEKYQTLVPKLTTLPSYSFQEYQALCLQHPTTFVWGTKIGQFEDPQIAHRVNRLLTNLGHWSAQGCCLFGICSFFLNPDLPPLKTPDDLTPKHAQWAENFMLELFTRCGLPLPKQVGILQTVDDEVLSLPPTQPSSIRKSFTSWKHLKHKWGHRLRNTFPRRRSTHT